MSHEGSATDLQNYYHYRGKGTPASEAVVRWPSVAHDSLDVAA